VSGFGLPPSAIVLFNLPCLTPLFTFHFQSKPGNKAGTTKPVVGKGGKTAPKHKFIIDYARPVSDQIFDTAAFEKFLHDHIKVDGKEGNLGDKVKITKSMSVSFLQWDQAVDIGLHYADDQRLTLTSHIPFSKRYLKYLTKKFLKKSTLRDFIRHVDPPFVAQSTNIYLQSSCVVEGYLRATVLQPQVRFPVAFRWAATDSDV
jgi:large subunit ribosomal protein L22e